MCEGDNVDPRVEIKEKQPNKQEANAPNGQLNITAQLWPCPQNESQSKADIRGVNPQTCKQSRGRSRLSWLGLSYSSSARVLNGSRNGVAEVQRFLPNSIERV